MSCESTSEILTCYEIYNLLHAEEKKRQQPERFISIISAES